MYSHDDMLQRIKDEKKKQKLTNKALSEVTNISLGTINKILSGDSKDPQVSAIIKIAQALNVSADYVIFGKEAEKQCNDIGIQLYHQLDDEDKAEIRGEMKQMLKTAKYNKTSIGDEIADDITKLMNMRAHTNVK
ncbi:MAG: helix-turn-helix domain-containing protein [Candidatus Ornithomonoglobus sp.]